MRRLFRASGLRSRSEGSCYRPIGVSTGSWLATIPPLASATTASPGAMGLEVCLDLLFGHTLRFQQAVEMPAEKPGQLTPKICWDPTWFGLIGAASLVNDCVHKRSVVWSSATPANGIEPSQRGSAAAAGASLQGTALGTGAVYVSCSVRRFVTAAAETSKTAHTPFTARVEPCCEGLLPTEAPACNHPEFSIM